MPSQWICYNWCAATPNWLPFKHVCEKLFLDRHITCCKLLFFVFDDPTSQWVLFRLMQNNDVNFHMILAKFLLYGPIPLQWLCSLLSIRSWKWAILLWVNVYSPWSPCLLLQLPHLHTLSFTYIFIAGTSISGGEVCWPSLTQYERHWTLWWVYFLFPKPDMGDVNPVLTPS